MLLRPKYLSQNLDRPLPTKDGGTLRTIREAVDYMTGLDKTREMRSQWQRVAKLILAKDDVIPLGRSNSRYSWTPSWTCHERPRSEAARLWTKTTYC